MSRSLPVISRRKTGLPVGELPAQADEEFTMDASVDTTSDLVTGIADVRNTTLGRLAQVTGVGDGLNRVLADSSAKRAAVAAFQSSI
jgi:hypothetical protein